MIWFVVSAGASEDAEVREHLLEGGRAPRFVDDEGTHCAVGYLMALDAPELVELGTPGVAEWAEEHGFSLQELAWIQPSYAPMLPVQRVVPPCRERLFVSRSAGDPIVYRGVSMCALDCGTLTGELTFYNRTEPGIEFEEVVDTSDDDSGFRPSGYETNLLNGIGTAPVELEVAMECPRQLCATAPAACWSLLGLLRRRPTGR